jgi:uncharacterized membrane protein YfcA
MIILNHLNSHPFNIQTAALLFVAALLGGALNAVAGGGSFIAFPSLLFTGVPAVPANATNTVALWTGLVFSGGAFRSHLKVRRVVLITLIGVSLIGGVLGALLLLKTPANTFLRILPWLMLSATLLFIFGPKLTRGSAGRIAGDRPGLLIAASLCQLGIAVYGGYFGGGMGFVILAMLTAFGMADIHEMNALKTVLSSATNGLAVVVFVAKHAVYWPQAVVMIAGAALGGYFGAHYSMRTPQGMVRWFVIAIGTGLTAYFFVRAY